MKSGRQVSKLLLAVFAVSLLASGCSVDAAVSAPGDQAFVALPGVQAPIGQDATSPPRVLFVGSSYTIAYSLAFAVATIAEANGVRLITQTHANSSAGLADHVVDPALRSSISAGNYDVVVLQERSLPPAIPDQFASDTTPAAIELSDLVRDAGAGVLLFETWGHANGNTRTGHATFDAMQQQISVSYDQLGEQLGAWVAPVGTAWQEAMLAAPEIELHSADASNPSSAGTYLAALIIADVFVVGPLNVAPDVSFVEAFTGESVVLADSATAAKLLQVAALVDEH